MAELPEAWRPPERDEWTARFDSPVSAAEAYATRTAVGMYDLSSLKRLELSGTGALGLLEQLTTSPMDRPVGGVTYTLMLDDAGGIRSDLTVARVAEDLFQVGANGGIDAAYLARQAQDWNRDPSAGRARVEDITDRTCCIGVWGPRARDLVQPLTGQDLSNRGLPYFRTPTATVAGIEVRMLRVSYVGELGRDPFQSGLGFAVRPGKAGYRGRDAVERLREQDAGTRDRLRCLTVDDAVTVVMGSEPVFASGRRVGDTTSAAYGYTVHRPIAYAWLSGDVEVGDTVTIRSFDRMVPATVAATPLVDPDGAALRC